MYLARSGSPGRRHASAYSPGSALHVDRHPRDPIGQDQVRGAHRRAARSSRSSATAPRIRSSASSSRTSPVAGSAASPGSRRTAGSWRSATPARTSFRRAAGCGVVRRRDRARQGADADRRAGRGERALGGRAAQAAARPARTGPGQPVYTISAAPEPGETGLRPARLADLDLLVPACARAHEVELGIDPLARDADGFRWRTRTQIEEGRSWLWAEDGVILFKAEASAWTPAAVQLQQVWTDPAARGAGNGEPRAARPDPPAARAGAARLPLRPGRQPGRDRALREGRHAARARLPERAAVRELVLARHAESEWNVLERLNGDPAVAVGLTEAGASRRARSAGRRARSTWWRTPSSCGRARPPSSPGPASRCSRSPS